MNPKDRIKELQQELTHAQYLYYVKDAVNMIKNIVSLWI